MIVTEREEIRPLGSSDTFSRGFRYVPLKAVQLTTKASLNRSARTYHPVRHSELYALFNKRFRIVFTNGLARRAFLQISGRLGTNERVFEAL